MSKPVQKVRMESEHYIECHEEDGRSRENNISQTTCETKDTSNQVQLETKRKNQSHWVVTCICCLFGFSERTRHRPIDPDSFHLRFLAMVTWSQSSIASKVRHGGDMFETVIEEKHVYIMFISCLSCFQWSCKFSKTCAKTWITLPNLGKTTRSALQIGFQLSRCHTRLFGAESRSTCFEDVWNFGQRHKRYEQLHIHTVMEAANGAMVCFFNKLTEDDTGKTFYVEQHSKTVWKRPCEWHFTKKTGLFFTWNLGQAARKCPQAPGRILVSFGCFRCKYLRHTPATDHRTLKFIHIIPWCLDLDSK